MEYIIIMRYLIFVALMTTTMNILTPKLSSELYTRNDDENGNIYLDSVGSEFKIIYITKTDLAKNKRTT